jgi:hypothetical protein
MNDRIDPDLQQYFHCQRQGHITKNSLSNQQGDSQQPANTEAKVSTETTWILITSIENYWTVASSTSSRSDWLIDCGCMTHISGCRSMFIIYTKYSPNTTQLKGNNGATSFASSYGTVGLINQLPVGKTKMIISQEVVHLPHQEQ